VSLGLAALNEFRNLFEKQDPDFLDTVAQIKSLMTEHASIREFKAAA
jgi:hypothetical protein